MSMFVQLMNINRLHRLCLVIQSHNCLYDQTEVTLCVKKMKDKNGTLLSGARKYVNIQFDYLIYITTFINNKLLTRANLLLIVF